MGRLRIGDGTLAQWVRGGLVAGLVVVMAAVSSGALGTPAWATTGVPNVPVYQADNTPDNNDVPGTPGQTTLGGVACPGTTFLFVASLTGFAIGNIVRINPGGPNQEDARVVDVGCNGRFLHLAEPFQFRHNSGERVIVVAQSANSSTTTTVNQRNNDDRERSQSQRRTEAQRQQSEQTNRSGRDDLHTEGDVSAVDLSKQPPEITILTRDGPQIVQLLCGDQCPTIRVGDYVEVDGIKQNEGLFYADTVTVTRR